MAPCKLLLVLSASFCLWLPCGSAATLNVPADYPTIMEAIQVSLPGDTVLVGPGTYPENLSFLGKDISVIGSAGPNNTVIDGQNKGSVVSFERGESNAALLQGFTLTCGSGTITSLGEVGGGIFAFSASPIIAGNKIAENSCNDLGGGIFFNGGSPEIMNNSITENSASHGGGIYFTHTEYPVISGNVVSQNSATDYGVGIELFQAGTCLVENNELSRNKGNGSANGGGIDIYQTKATFQNNIVYANDSMWSGGAMYAEDCPSLHILNNFFVENVGHCKASGIVL